MNREYDPSRERRGHRRRVVGLDRRVDHRSPTVRPHRVMSADLNDSPPASAPPIHYSSSAGGDFVP